MNDNRVAVFGAGERRVEVYHICRDQSGVGMTLCGLLFDSTCKRTDAINARLRRCWKCERKAKP